MPIEKIVRPFQKVDRSPSNAVPTVSVSGLSAPVINRWGERGEVKQYSGSISISQTYYMVHRPVEVKGGTDTYVDDLASLPIEYIDDLEYYRSEDIERGP